MESPGKHLKRERESRNLTVREVSASTRIKETILNAIEEDRFDLCPHPFYVKGFLISYARHLGIDPTSVLSEYRELVNPPAPPPEPAPAEKPKEPFLFLDRVQRRTAYRFVLVSVLLVSLLTPLYFYYTFQFAHTPVPVALNEQERVTPQDRENSSLVAASLMTAEVASESQQKTEPVEVEPKQENPPVLQQIKQLEMIGPKEVQAESFPKVLEAHLGTGIETENGRPMVIGKGSEFRCENQRVYFFTRILTGKEGKVFHVWQREGEEFHRIEMPVTPPSWSVYSYITLPPSRFGNWNAEVRDGDKVLTRLSFKAH